MVKQLLLTVRHFIYIKAREGERRIKKCNVKIGSERGKMKSQERNKEIRKEGRGVSDDISQWYINTHCLNPSPILCLSLVHSGIREEKREC